MTTKYYDPKKKLDAQTITATTNFLFQHLGEYGDAITAIQKAVDYSMADRPLDGGFIILAIEDEQIVGATVINKTGMDEYIPENILVYIATHKDYRGKGIGKTLIKEAIERCKGGIALHVEPDNPAKLMYEKLGFENKYLEYRLLNN